MRCLDDDLVQMFVEGTLDASEATIVRLHVSRCRTCQGSVAAYKQLMWDLEHPDEPELPEELKQMHQTLVAVWREGQQKEVAAAPAPRSLIPAWAGYTVRWARHVPPLEQVGTVVIRAGKRWVRSRLTLPRWIGGRRGARR